MLDWDALQSQCLSCTRCGLCQTRNNVVFGVGVRDADIILVNYNKPSIGTSMEVFYAAHDLGKFVVSFSPFSFEDCSPWMVKHSTKILGSLEEACAYIQEHFGTIPDPDE